MALRGFFIVRKAEVRWYWSNMVDSVMLLL